MLQLYPAVIIRELNDATASLAPGLPVTLISEQGAGLYGGAGWWRAVVAKARAIYPATPAQDVLDCADGSGQALAALRIGQQLLVLDRSAPGWEAVCAIAMERGGGVLSVRPLSLDLGQRGAARRLDAWLRGDDIRTGLG